MSVIFKVFCSNQKRRVGGFISLMSLIKGRSLERMQHDILHGISVNEEQFASYEALQAELEVFSTQFQAADVWVKEFNTKRNYKSVSCILYHIVLTFT